MDEALTRRSSRRVSFRDDQGAQLAEAIAACGDGVTEVPLEQFRDSPGELTISFGIVRIGCLYGRSVGLPRVLSAQPVHPLPPGITAEARLLDDGSHQLWLQLEVSSEGRQSSSFKLLLQSCDAQFYEMTVHVQAQVMSRRDGRPSRTQEDVYILRHAPPEVSLIEPSAAQEWQAAKTYLSMGAREGRQRLRCVKAQKDDSD